MDKTAILRVKDKDGNIIDIPAITGAPGKSAYQAAKENGYEGTEEEFNTLLGSLGSVVGGATEEAIAEAVEEHDNDTGSHGDIRTMLEQYKYWEEYPGAALSVLDVMGRRIRFFLGSEEEYEGLTDSIKQDNLIAFTTDDAQSEKFDNLFTGEEGVKRLNREYIGNANELSTSLQNHFVAANFPFTEEEEEKYQDLTEEEKLAKKYTKYLQADPNQEIQNSTLNFSNNPTILKGGVYTGVMIPSLASYLYAPSIAYSTYFVLETVQYGATNKESSTGHWLVQIFRGITDPTVEDHGGSFVEFKRTRYTKNGVQTWGKWVETIDRNNPVAHHFSTTFLGNANELQQQIDNEPSSTEQKNLKMNSPLNFYHNKKLESSGRYTGLMTPGLAESLFAPPIKRTVYFILDTVRYGDEVVEKSRGDWIVQTFVGITAPGYGRHAGRPVCYIRTMTTTTTGGIQHTWSPWYEIHHEASAATDTHSFNETTAAGNYDKMLQLINSYIENSIEGTITITLGAQGMEFPAVWHSNGTTKTIAAYAKGTLTICNDVSLQLVAPNFSYSLYGTYNSTNSTYTWKGTFIAH